MKKKKILGFLAATTMTFGVAGCLKEKEVTFEEYLESHETYTAAKLDSGFGAIDFDRDTYLSALGITNTKATITTGDLSINAYAWSGEEYGDQYLYVAGPFDGVHSTAYKVNLSTIDEVVNETKDYILENSPATGVFEDTNESGKIEFSEIIENYLTTMGLDTDEINVDSILSKIKFDINDFEDEGNGVYKLKTSAMNDLIEDITGMDTGYDEDDIETIEEMLEVKFRYNENHVRAISIDFENVTQSDYTDISSTTRIVLDIDFSYEKDTLTETTFNFMAYNSEYDGTEVTDSSYADISVTNGENGFSFAIKTGESATNISQKLQLSIENENAKTTLKTKFENDGETMFDVSLGVIGNWISDASISLNVEETGSLTVAVESNVNVTISQVIKDLPATDVTEAVLETISNMM